MRPLRDPANQALPDCPPRVPGELPPPGTDGGLMWWLYAMCPGMGPNASTYTLLSPTDRARWRGDSNDVPEPGECVGADRGIGDPSTEHPDWSLTVEMPNPGPEVLELLGLPVTLDTCVPADEARLIGGDGQMLGRLTNLDGWS